jgi:hypothetical protein
MIITLGRVTVLAGHAEQGKCQPIKPLDGHLTSGWGAEMMATAMI